MSYTEPNNGQEWARVKLWPIFNEIAPNEFDAKYIVHYCSSSTAYSIIKNRNLLFSPLDIMNDYNEYYFMFNKIIFALKERQSLTKSNFLLSLLNIISNSHSIQSNNCYVFCLSMANTYDDIDKLSMWRAYASDGEGCALVFDCDTVLATPNEHKFPISGWAVNYFNDNGAEEMARLIVKKI